jgi:hypothetical protein
MNLLGITRGAIGAVNPDRPGTLYTSTGYTNSFGILTPTFTSAPAWFQVQALAHDKLVHARGLNYASDLWTIYADGDLAAVDRPSQTGGAVIQLTDDGSWYAVTLVNEWWPDWCCVDATRQLNAPNIAALIAAIQNGTNPA